MYVIESELSTNGCVQCMWERLYLQFSLVVCVNSNFVGLESVQCSCDLWILWWISNFLTIRLCGLILIFVNIVQLNFHGVWNLMRFFGYEIKHDPIQSRNVLLPSGSTNTNSWICLFKWLYFPSMIDRKRSITSRAFDTEVYGKMWNEMKSWYTNEEMSKKKILMFIRKLKLQNQERTSNDRVS